MSSYGRDTVISVFGSHAPKPGSRLYEMARELGGLLAEAGFTVASGGYEGTMAGVSQGAAEAGGHTIGVTSSVVKASRDVSLNRWIGKEVQYESLQDRLYHLVTKNDGMVVLEGGIGTLSELSLAWSLLQVREIDERPLILLGQLWKDTLPVFIREEYVSEEITRLITMVDSPSEAVEYLMSFRAGARKKEKHDF